jgi:hypothetical protein
MSRTKGSACRSTTGLKKINCKQQTSIKAVRKSITPSAASPLAMQPASMLEEGFKGEVGFTLECCVDSVVSTRNAIAGGASRVELCDNLIEGGTTPSMGMIMRCKEVAIESKKKGKKQAQVFVIIRPRGGDFLYSEDEFNVRSRPPLSSV